MGGRAFVAVAVAVGLIVPVLVFKLAVVAGLLVVAVAAMAWGVEALWKGENDG